MIAAIKYSFSLLPAVRYEESRELVVKYAEREIVLELRVYRTAPFPAVSAQQRVTAFQLEQLNFPVATWEEAVIRSLCDTVRTYVVGEEGLSDEEEI